MEKYFECVVSYETEDEKSGKIIKVSENHLTSGETFGDAENKILTEIAKERLVSPQVMSEKVVSFNGILESGSGSERWYTVKTQWVDINDKGKEIKCKEQYLVPSETTNEALVKILKYLENTTLDYEVLSIVKSKIVGVTL